jgi:hypothetical protein
MHVHGNQFDPNIQLNALYAAERDEAERDAERTRRRLLNAAATLPEEAAVVSLSGDDSQQEQPHQRDRQDRQRDQADSDSPADLFSDWA